MKTGRLILIISLIAVAIQPVLAEPAAPLSALAQMPVREITVFKDGNAFVLHQGSMPTNSSGDVVLDYLPTPVLGTFWPYSADKSVSLNSVVASSRRVMVPRTALTLPELLRANPGADVQLVDSYNNTSYAATIVGVPEQSSEEQQTVSPPASDEKLPQPGSVIMIKTSTGVSVMPIDRIQTVTFKGNYSPTLAAEEFRNLLTLKMDWHGHSPAKTADVGMMYLQKGIRWIPSYKIVIDGAGNATVKLQATLINEMTDLQDVTANLVIGVPSFTFAGQTDPIALQQTLANLSPYFNKDSDFSNGLSNAAMSQVVAYREAAAPTGPDLGPVVSDAGKNEDLFVFTIKHITLKKGQRMVLPVAEYPLKYKDVYTLDIPAVVPNEVRQSYSSSQTEIDRLIAAPKVEHKLRFINNCEYPLTTAPALVLQGDRVLSQGLMSYTAVNSTVDLDLTTAVDVQVKRKDHETARTANVSTWEGYQYGQVDMAGALHLTNYSAHPVDLEVTRQVLGNAVSADSGGSTDMLDMFDSQNNIGNAAAAWSYLPGWWSHFNGLGQFKWTLTLQPSKSADLGYKWNYLWR